MKLGLEIMLTCKGETTILEKDIAVEVMPDQIPDYIICPSEFPCFYEGVYSPDQQRLFCLERGTWVWRFLYLCDKSEPLVERLLAAGWRTRPDDREFPSGVK